MDVRTDIFPPSNIIRSTFGSRPKNTLSSTGLYELVLVAVHMEHFQMYSLNVRATSTLFLMTSTTKQIWLNGKRGQGGAQDGQGLIS